MRFDSFGWLDVATREPTLNFNAGAGDPELVVLHYTASYDALSAIRTFRNTLSRASAHFVVATDGKITQMVSVRDDAWHAGGGVHQGRESVNSFSVGIEIVNPGYHFSDGAGGWLNWERKPVSKAMLKPFGAMVEVQDPWVGSARQYWPGYPEPQLAAVQKLVLTLLTTYPAIKDVVGHRDVDGIRKRKVDPGPAFPMARMKALLDKKIVPPAPRPLDYLVKSEAGYLNVRQKPSLTAPKADWSPLLNGERVQRLDMRPDWFRIRRWKAGVPKEGWVMARYLVEAP